MNSKESSKNGNPEHIAAQTFSFRELATATRNFKAECLLGEGGFGRVYKGRLENINQVSLFLIISVFTKSRWKFKGNDASFLLVIHHVSLIHVAFWQPE